MRYFSQSWRMLVAFAFMTLVPLVAHLLYSMQGFNPAHDIAVLAAARRLLLGQVPHLEFIYIHPIMSPLIHVPILLLGGEHMLWLLRLFIWVQLAAIAWTWVALVDRFLKANSNLPSFIALAFLALVFSATSFPNMALHALNGLFFATIGLALCLRDRPALKVCGYFLCGCAVLCKPSFAVSALVLLLTTPDRRRLKYWLAAALPGIMYMLFLVSAGALYDAVLQIFPWATIQPGLRITQFKFSVYMAVGYFAMRLIYGLPCVAFAPNRRRVQVAAGWLLIACAPLFLNINAIFNGFSEENTLDLFWTLAGAGIYFVLETNDRRQSFGRLACWAVAMGWAVAVTRYRVSPAIAGGILMTPLVIMCLAIIPSAVARTGILIIVAGATLFGFNNGRQLINARYMLDHPLDKSFPGAEGIYASPNTHMFAADLQQAVALAGQWPRPFAIIPDCPGYWAASGHANPMPFDSLREIEYFNPDMLDRVMRSIGEQRPILTILLQTVDAGELGSTNEIRKLRHYRNRIYNHIRNDRNGFKKIGKTMFFELYE